MDVVYKIAAALMRYLHSFEIRLRVDQQSRFCMVILIGDREVTTVTPPALQSENALRRMV